MCDCKYVGVMYVCVCVCAGFKQSLVVDYNLLASKQPPIAVLLPDAPIEMFRIFDEVSEPMNSFRVVVRSSVALVARSLKKSERVDGFTLSPIGL